MERVKTRPVHLKHTREQTVSLHLAIALSWEGTAPSAARRTRTDGLYMAVMYMLWNLQERWLFWTCFDLLVSPQRRTLHWEPESPTKEAMWLSPKTHCQGLQGQRTVRHTGPLWGWPVVAVTLR